MALRLQTAKYTSVMSEYHKTNNVVSLGDLKQAALYFDKILPVFMKDTIFITSKTYDFLNHSTTITYRSNLDEKIIANLVLGPDTKEIKLHTTLASNIFGGMMYVLEAFVRSRCKGNPYGNLRDKITEFYLQNTEIPYADYRTKGVQNFRQYIKYWSSFFGVIEPAVLLPANAEAQCAKQNSQGEDLVVELVAAKLIDTENLEWEQIYEVRRDEDSRRKLRNLRLFLHEHYSDRSVSFIEDDLARRLEDYEEARKRHGLDTVNSVLSETLSATNLISFLGTGFAASIFGGAIAGIGSATILEIGKIALTLDRRKSIMSKLKEDHELAYCIKIQEKAKNE